MKFFNIEDVVVDLNIKLINFNIGSSNQDVNADVVQLTEVFKETLNKHVPLRPMSRREL